MRMIILVTTNLMTRNHHQKCCLIDDVVDEVNNASKIEFIKNIELELESYI